MTSLIGCKVAAIATHGFEQTELIEPMQALHDAGACVDVVAPRFGEIHGFQADTRGPSVLVNRLLSSISPDEYEALLLPGGDRNVEALRVIPGLKSLIRRFNAAGKPIAAISHAPGILVSARVVNGRHLTSIPMIRDDVRNAGGRWSDQTVVVDRNWVTGRMSADQSAFNQAMIELFASAVPAQERHVLSSSHY